MMKKYIFLLIISGFSMCAQESGKKISFDKLIQNFKELSFLTNQSKDSITHESLFKSEDFNISISQNLIQFTIDSVVLVNPYYTDDYDDYDDNYINFPISFSVIYQDKLISLFENGKFVCYRLNGFLRDEEYEKKLNTKKFKQHWVIDGKLYAFSNKLFEWNNKEWIKSETKIPIEKQPILFEDEEYIVFRDCHGEWGGTVYFYERKTSNIYFTESTCANTVFKKDAEYIILAHLGHMSGSSEVKSIADPRLLSKIPKKNIGETVKGEAMGYADRSGAYRKLVDFYNIQLFSTFKYNGLQLYLAHIYGATFLAEIKEKEVEIVNPFLNNVFYTHDPVTRSYGGYTLINLDFYGIALDREISVIIIKDNKITIAEWNENHNN